MLWLTSIRTSSIFNLISVFNNRVLLTILFIWRIFLMKNYDICHIDLKNHQGNIQFNYIPLLLHILVIFSILKMNQNEKTYFMLNFRATGRLRTSLICSVRMELFMLPGSMTSQLLLLFKIWITLKKVFWFILILE